MRFWRVTTASRQRLSEIDYVVLDTELTSLDRRHNRLLSVGAVRMHGRRIELGSEFYRVANPGVAVPGETIVIHQLTGSDVERGESPKTVVQELCAYVGGAVLVGHFARIDVEVLRTEFKVLGLALDSPAIDTARAFRWLEMQRRYREHGWEHIGADLSLLALAQRYGIAVDATHHALYDAFVTAQLWQRLQRELELEGIRELRQLLRIARA